MLFTYSITFIQQKINFCTNYYIYICLCSQYLPEVGLYAPPLNIRIVDRRTHGQERVVGTHVITSLKDYHVDPSGKLRQVQPKTSRQEFYQVVGLHSSRLHILSCGWYCITIPTSCKEVDLYHMVTKQVVAQIHKMAVRSHSNSKLHDNDREIFRHALRPLMST